VFVTFVLIFKFILIYLLHVFKINDIFEKKSQTQKYAERGNFLYIEYRYRYVN